MEIRASEAVKERQQWENHIARCLQQERADFEKKRQRESENQESAVSNTSFRNQL